MQTGICALCGEKKILRISHIIPKFASKWLKETSATGFLRGAEKPEQRLQDFAKLPLLCGECEQLFSKFECYFANKVFFPILNEKATEVNYDENLLKFIVSLNWRALNHSFELQCRAFPWIKEHVERTEKVWREYLLGIKIDVQPYEHYMSFMNFLPDNIEIPKKFNFYVLRGVDSTLASNNENTVYAFSHLPHFFFVSSIFPISFAMWENVKIANKGVFRTNFESRDEYFNNFLVSRCNKIIQISGKGKAKLNSQVDRALDLNPEKFLKSHSLKVHLNDSKRNRLKKIEKLPEGIKALIDIIDSSIDNPEYNSVQQGWNKWTQDFIANSLSNLPLDKAIIIEALIASTIALAENKHRISECNFQTEDLIVKYMVTLCDSKEEQIIHLEKALDSLIEKRSADDQRLPVVFSFNPYDSDMPFETAYYTGYKSKGK